MEPDNGRQNKRRRSFNRGKVQTGFVFFCSLHLLSCKNVSISKIKTVCQYGTKYCSNIFLSWIGKYIKRTPLRNVGKNQMECVVKIYNGRVLLHVIIIYSTFMPSYDCRNSLHEKDTKGSDGFDDLRSSIELL